MDAFGMEMGPGAALVRLSKCIRKIASSARLRRSDARWKEGNGLEAACLLNRCSHVYFQVCFYEKSAC